MSIETKFPGGTWTGPRFEQGLIGGAGIGGSLALLSMLNDQIRSNRRKDRADKGKVLEDTLVIDPLTKGATLTQWAGMLAAGTGTYMLLQKAYQALREKQLAAEIDEEQDQYVDSLMQTVPPKTKKAGDGMDRLWEYAASAPQDMMWIPGLVSAAGTYGLLNHIWPKVGDKQEAGKPKKIVVRGHGTVIADGPGDGPIAQLDKERTSREVKRQVSDEQPTGNSWADPRLAKAASVSCPFGLDDYISSAASMAFLLAEQPELKEASSSLVGLMVAFKQAPEQTEILIKEAGVLAALELSHGLCDAYYDMAPLDKLAAAHSAFRSPVLRPGLTLLTVAEMNEVCPDLSKRAQVVADDDYYGPIATKMASVHLQIEFALADVGGLAKSAAAASTAGEMRRQMGTLGISESKDSGGQMDEADDAYSDETDPIDEFLAGKKKGPNPG